MKFKSKVVAEKLNVKVCIIAKTTVHLRVKRYFMENYFFINEFFHLSYICVYSKTIL